MRADAGRALIELVDQADAVGAQLRDDANAFAQSLDEIGNAHAARIEKVLTHLRDLVETVGADARIDVRASQYEALAPAKSTGSLLEVVFTFARSLQH